ncbi:hypothetical protein B7P33_04740 [Sediminicola luteus]|uniref:Cardiolipin synthase N-terminal domain-containing protein n=1 Tax=Sediminicola luteus TaxID=319238 RepID=A0A2A4GF65_9FLAO|nr:hypothetical protein B7P33_04740 [Sediminicola luteus]
MEIDLADFSPTLFLSQVLAVLHLTLCMYCLVEIFRSQNKSENKFLWVLIVFFIPLIGSLVYINRSRINNTNTY